MAQVVKLSILMVLLAALGTGCGSSSGMVANLPQPHFGGPTINPPRVAVTPTPRPQAQTAVRPGLMPSDRAWIPTTTARPWKWIVVHHSATPSGSAAVFDKMHRDKGWDELGYHFVIGNGTDSGNGQVEVGSRWPVQKHGAHAKTADQQYNNFGIGICLVGNFDIERPTPQQLQSLARLVSFLMQTYRIPASNVIGHKDTKPTDCPGRNMNLAVVRRMATQVLVDAGIKVDESELDDAVRTAGATELLQDASQDAVVGLQQ